MKSRTSSSNLCLLKKDITRFAPVWGLYLAFLLLCLLAMSDNSEYRFLRSISDSAQVMAAVNMGYAFLCVQMLFGDLFNTRMCNALHALPIRRERWFVTHVAAALLFALVPYLICAGIGVAILGEYSVAAWIWLLAAAGQYLCFLGIAVFSAMCAGNRFAMLVVYGLINFFAVIVYWMIYNIYEPLLFGISLDLEWLLYFMPVAGLVANVSCMDIERHYSQMVKDYEILDITFGEGWHWVGIYLLLGVALTVLAMALYRRRKLEVAGDFLAVRQLEPVFLVIFTLSAGNVCQIVCELFGLDSGYYLFLAVGMVIGFFVGRMLLKRTVRVFEPKALIPLGALGAAVALSALLVALDPLGITRWVPDTREVASVTVWSDGYISEYNDQFTVTDPADVDAIRAVHQNAIDARVKGPDDGPPAGYAYFGAVDMPAIGSSASAEEPGTYFQIALRYTLRSGRTAERYYYVFTTDADGKTLEAYFSTPQSVMGIEDQTRRNTRPGLSTRRWRMTPFSRTSSWWSWFSFSLRTARRAIWPSPGITTSMRTPPTGSISTIKRGTQKRNIPLTVMCGCIPAMKTPTTGSGSRVS